MNINPFVPSDIHSKISYDNMKSHSSMSRDGHEVMFTMKESLRDIDYYNMTPEQQRLSPLPLMNSAAGGRSMQQHYRYSRNQDERALFSSSHNNDERNGGGRGDR